MAQTLGSVAVGSIFKLNENGSPVNYIVVHQGLPSSSYDSSCDGTWLLRQDIAENRVWDSGNSNVLESSDIQSYLNGTWINRYDTDIRNAIKQVKIPYRQNGGSSGTDQTGANGLSCKVFLLSGYEVGFTTSVNPYFPVDGAKLAYFLSGNDSSANQKRVATLNGSATLWWLRSPGTDGAWLVKSDGNYGRWNAGSSHGVRPAFTLPSDLSVLDDGTIIVPPNPPAAMNVPQLAMQGNQLSVSWSAVDGADGYILERKANTDSDWTQVYSGANTSFEETVGTWTSVQYRVKAGVSGTYGDYTTSASVPVVSASAVVISGTDGDLGTLVNDVSYTVSSDGSTELTVVETINGTETRTYTATNGGTNKIPVVDLPTGYGTISITASTNPGSGVVSVERNWTYTKAAITFPDAGSVADLLQNGKTIWAKTIAEAVRTPGIWGGNLGLALSKLAQAMLYDPSDSTFTDISGGAIPMVSIETGRYTGTGTYGENNPNRLTFKGKPIVVFIVDHNDPSANELMRVWMFPCFSYNRNNNEYDDPGYFNIAESFGNGYGQPEYIFAKVSGTTLMWYGEDSADDQINSSTNRYYYFALTSLGGAST